MIKVRKAEDRGQANYGWLQTSHSFSFANYYDPNYLGFRSLRVINEDSVEPQAGFSSHYHRDMEILTYVLEGAIAHQDSLGNSTVIKPGEIQRMSAGKGILHSEFNPSSTDTVRFLQIWITPQAKGLQPSYQQKSTHLTQFPSKLHLIASSQSTEEAVTIHQDVNLYAAKLVKGDRISYSLFPHRYAWIQVVKGGILLNNQPLETSDGAAISQASNLFFEAQELSEILLFDLA